MPGPSKVDVVCDRCTACCFVRAFLFKQDDLDLYEHKHLLSEEEPAEPFFEANSDFSGYVLDRDDAGRCVYLSDVGCTIYDERPLGCRMFSCVRLVEQIEAEPAEQRLQEIVHSAVYAAGLARRSVA